MNFFKVTVVFFFLYFGKKKSQLINQHTRQRRKKTRAEKKKNKSECIYIYIYVYIWRNFEVRIKKYIRTRRGRFLEENSFFFSVLFVHTSEKKTEKEKE